MLIAPTVVVFVTNDPAVVPMDDRNWLAVLMAAIDSCALALPAVTDTLKAEFIVADAELTWYIVNAPCEVFTADLRVGHHWLAA